MEMRLVGCGMRGLAILISNIWEITEKLHGWRPPGHQGNHWDLQGLCCWKAPWAQVRSREGKMSYMHLGDDTFWYQKSHAYHIHEWIKVSSNFYGWFFQVHMGLLSQKEVWSMWKFTELKALIENGSGLKIKILRSDNGREYVSNDFLHICSQSGIQVQHSTPLHSPVEWCSGEEESVS